MQFGSVNLYVRIVHQRDADSRLTVKYSTSELGRYQVQLTAAVNSLQHILTRMYWPAYWTKWAFSILLNNG